MSDLRLAFLSSGTPDADKAQAGLIARYKDYPIDKAEVIVAIGGDGFMLQTLHQTQHLPAPVYGMNRGTVGFLLNEFRPEGLTARLAAAEEALIHPLAMTAVTLTGEVHEALAINEVSLLRSGPQAAKLAITVDGRKRMDTLICDGVLLATPAGSTAYNYSAHGPILPIGADVMALTPVAAFRPRRWRGALLPKGARVRFDVLEPRKRPVMATADSVNVTEVASVEIQMDLGITHRLLFDPGHGLEERLIREQFE